MKELITKLIRVQTDARLNVEKHYTRTIVQARLQFLIVTNR